MKRIAINAFLFISIAVLLSLITRHGKPIARGFYCDDSSLNKPYSASTIPSNPLFISGLSLASILFAFGIYQRFVLEAKEPGKDEYKKLLLCVLTLSMLFIYGTGITLLLTVIGKYSVGRLRPHYFSVCQPDWHNINCTNPIGEKKLIYGKDVCRTANVKVFNESHLSFPSGHASFSGFAASFLVLFLETQVKFIKGKVLLKYMLQALLGLAASGVGLSRVTDYMHHPTDVIAGFVLGICVGVIMHYSLVKLYYPLLRTNKVKGEHCS